MVVVCSQGRLGIGIVNHTSETSKMDKTNNIEIKMKEL